MKPSESFKNSFKNKTAIVTGAASGIGAASAWAFAREGASVILADVLTEQGQKLAQQIQTEGYKAVFVKTDVSNEADVKNMIQATIQNFGRLDFAFNNAGIEGKPSSTVECDNENWDRTININLKGVWWCMKYQIPEMLKTGGGAIVNCSSIAGVIGFPGIPAYTASKHGVIGLTKTAALEYANQNIRVNAICPGVIQTPMIDRFTGGNKEAAAGMAQGAPMNRMGTPDEIAHAALWLCSDHSSFITGHPLVADGGWVVR